MKKRLGFTLAETLIALGIIGIIAALTIPAFMENTEIRQLKIAFKNVYSDLSSATLSIKNDNGGVLANYFSDTSDIRDKYAQKLKTIKSCDLSDTDGCWNYKWKEYNSTTDMAAPSFPALIMTNGTILVFENYFSAACNSKKADGTTTVSANVSLPNICNDILVDVNGSKAPNRIGKDIFYVWILSDSMKPAGTSDDKNLFAPTTCVSTNGGWGCAAKVIDDEDY